MKPTIKMKVEFRILEHSGQRIRKTVWINLFHKEALQRGELASVQHGLFSSVVTFLLWEMCV